MTHDQFIELALKVIIILLCIRIYQKGRYTAEIRKHRKAVEEYNYLCKNFPDEMWRKD